MSYFGYQHQDEEVLKDEAVEEELEEHLGVMMTIVVDVAGLATCFLGLLRTMSSFLPFLPRRGSSD